MPLKALVNGKYMIGPLMSDDEWSALRESVKKGHSNIIIHCCNKPSHQRISKLNTKHFVHDRNAECNWEPESLEHLKIKSDIVQICADLGWAVDVEVEGDSWIADVLTTDGKRKIAFEVQMSNQTYEETINRTLKYANSGVEYYWLFRKIPKNNNVSSERLDTSSLYYCSVAVDRENSVIKSISVTIEDKTIPLREFIKGILLSKIKHCKKMKGVYRTTCKKIVFFTNTCWNCNKDYQAYYLEGESEFEMSLGVPDTIYESDCGLKYTAFINESDDESSDDEIVSPFNTKIIKTVENFLKTDEGKNIRIGEIKPRYSNTVGHSYTSFGCPYCDAIYGNWYYEEAIQEYELGDAEPLKILDVDIDLEYRRVERPKKHWCYPKNGEFCEG